MLNDVKIPPMDIGPSDGRPGTGYRPVDRSTPLANVDGRRIDEINDSPTHSRTHLKPTTDRNEPGLHRARFLGERGATDAVYEMPMEDRGSGFSIGLSICVMVIFVMLLVSVWMTLR